MFLLGWLAAGFGVVGQPHIMIRAMALDSPEKHAAARRVYVVWNMLFSISAVGRRTRCEAARDETTGLRSRARDAAPVSVQLLHPVLVGLVLAGLFAATMSTADSQVLSCSAAVTPGSRHPAPEPATYYNKLGTVSRHRDRAGSWL